MAFIVIVAVLLGISTGRRLGRSTYVRRSPSRQTPEPWPPERMPVFTADFEDNFTELGAIRKNQNSVKKVINLWEQKCRDPFLAVKAAMASPHTAGLFHILCGPAVALAQMVSQYFATPEVEESLGAEALRNFGILVQLLRGFVNTATTMNILDEKKQILFQSDGNTTRREKDRMDQELDDKIEKIYDGLNETHSQMLKNLEEIVGTTFTKSSLLFASEDVYAWDVANERYLKERMESRVIREKVDTWCTALPSIESYNDVDNTSEAWFACRHGANTSALSSDSIEQCGCIMDSDEIWHVTRDAVPWAATGKKSFLGGDPLYSIAYSHIYKHQTSFFACSGCDYIERECHWKCPVRKTLYNGQFNVRVIRNWVFYPHWMNQTSFSQWLTCEKRKPTPFAPSENRTILEDKTPCFVPVENSLAPEEHIRFVARAYVMLAAEHGAANLVHELRRETADTVKFLEQAKDDFNQYLAFYTSNTAMTAAIQNEELLKQNRVLLKKVEHIEQVVEGMASSSQW